MPDIYVIVYIALLSLLDQKERHVCSNWEFHPLPYSQIFLLFVAFKIYILQEILQPHDSSYPNDRFLPHHGPGLIYCPSLQENLKQPCILICNESLAGIAYSRPLSYVR